MRWIPSWRFTGGVCVTLAILMIAALLTGYALTSIPPPRPVTEAQATTVLYSNGSPLARFSVDEGNRTIVDIKMVPEHVQWAVIAAEDKTFYKNRGVSPIGIVRALWNNVRGKSMQGGSTITQQYVKNSRVGSERSLQRKIKEFFISIKIGNQTDKSKILGAYLNTIYFGRGTYGIQMASQSYFHRSVKDLTLAEGIYLATIIQQPERFSNVDPKNAEEVAVLQGRFDYVLDTMVELGKLTPERRAAADLKVPPKPFPLAVTKNRRVNDQTQYLMTMVTDELERNGIQMDEVRRAGWKIYTTFDSDLINKAVNAVQDKDIGMGPRKSWPTGTQVGLVAIEPKTGKVRAIYGGDGTRSYSAASQDQPQAGSTYKVFTLLAALEGQSKNGSDGISLKSRFNGKSPYTYKAGSVNSGSNKVTNYGNEQFGWVDLVHATAHSMNTVYAQLNEKIGEGTGARTRDAAIRAGIPKASIGNEVSNTLGNGTPRVVDMANAYATLAAGGVYHPYRVIEKIVTPLGAVVYPQGEPEGVKQFSQDVVADTTYALQQVIKTRGATGTYAKRLGRPAAGKTGTVGTTGRATKAAWFVGYTPQLATAVAIHKLGKDGKSADVVKGWGPYKGVDLTGAHFPVRIWTTFMKQALEGKPVEEFPERADVGIAENPEPVVTESPEASQDGQDGQNPDGQNPDGQDGQDGQNPDGENPDGQDDKHGGDQDDKHGGDQDDKHGGDQDDKHGGDNPDGDQDGTENDRSGDGDKDDNNNSVRIDRGEAGRGAGG
jgi:membrane peptidoglycan carboxypeptidase